MSDSMEAAASTRDRRGFVGRQDFLVEVGGPCKGYRMDFDRRAGARASASRVSSGLDRVVRRQDGRSV
ncbi:hypothetical protein ACFQ61_25215 [Streptomyces sp. NPDC056500]|uniref:hypothetical protein n=1 Tax=Streptomyces sp. NPDC056500 TaxID=3345840 RepID=UPI00367BCC76